MFVGETGLGRVVKRTLEVMKEIGTDDPAKVRAAGAIDLPTLQKYLNFWCSSSLDLFGSEISSNSAANFANGLKGRPDEAQYETMCLRTSTFKMATPAGRRRRSDAQRPERGDARVLPQGLRDRPEALEPPDRARRPRLPPHPALLALPPLDRRLGGPAGDPGGQADREGGVREDSLYDWIPSAGRPRLRALADAAGGRAGQDGRPGSRRPTAASTTSRWSTSTSSSTEHS